VTILFWLYLLAYIGISIAAVADSIATSHAPIFVAYEIIANILTIVGMLLFRYTRRSSLSGLWKLALVAIVVEFAIGNALDLRHMLSDPRNHRLVIFVSGLFTIAFWLPGFYLKSPIGPWPRIARKTPQRNA
jgi:hypothetical protein